MALLMKQQNRADEAIEAIQCFRDLCSRQAQESLDNVLIDLYKLKNYTAAETVYCKAQVVEPDANKACNLCTCLIKQGKLDEARAILFRDVLQEKKEGFCDDSRLKVRVQELLSELEPRGAVVAFVECEVGMDEIAVVEAIDEFMKALDRSKGELHYNHALGMRYSKITEQIYVGILGCF
ncbi:unnamed protein product [Eruca vesicaria subsp. sativa]|uniref:Uncharacterized protein n=1 Tax=Eruca vesicaria subsp. sativa TaxID=29727 RepID=A0ABC8LMV0_ERUVS|nr:unnamed protein product [Eruca vesicaria subsp. sativa]